MEGAVGHDHCRCTIAGGFEDGIDQQAAKLFAGAVKRQRIGERFVNRLFDVMDERREFGCCGQRVQADALAVDRPRVGPLWTEPVPQEHRAARGGKLPQLGLSDGGRGGHSMTFGEHAAAARFGDGQRLLDFAPFDEKVDVRRIKAREPRRKRQTLDRPDEAGASLLERLQSGIGRTAAPRASPERRAIVARPSCAAQRRAASAWGLVEDFLKQSGGPPRLSRDRRKCRLRGAS